MDPLTLAGRPTNYLRQHWNQVIVENANELAQKRGLHTRRSKLEMNVDLLRVLANKGPLKTTHIMQKINVNSKILKEYVEFLIKQGLVEERIVKEARIIYQITPRGKLVLKGFEEIEKRLIPSDVGLIHV